MFDLSWGELVLIGMVALIVIGPKELPTVLRTIGQWVTRIRRMASEFQGQFQEAMREAEFADLKKQVDSIGDPAQHLNEYNPFETAKREMESAFEDKPPVTESTSATAGDTGPVAAEGAPAPADAPPAPPAEAAQIETPADTDTERSKTDAGGGRVA